jgi:EmrB/QacA subfamily drug resistance transporter
MPPRGTRALTLVVASAFFVESLAATVIATSLAAMAADLGVDPVTLKLAFTAYFVAMAVAIPVSGWCADRFGTRRVFMAALLIFTLAGVLCALAWDFSSLIAGRFLQGVGGALMLPVGRLVVLRAVPRDQMVSAMAWMAIPSLLAPVMGPPLGGWITTYWHWRGIFWLGVPVGVLGALFAMRHMPQVRAETLQRLDLRGAVLVGLGLALATFGITLATSDGRELQTGLAMLLAGAGLLALYVRHEKRVEHPILDLTLMRIASFRVSVWAGAVFRIGSGAIPFLLPMMLQLGFGMTAFESGLLTFTAAVGAITMKMAAAPILRRWGFRQVLLINSVLSGLQMAAIGAFTAATPAAVIVSVLLIGGFFRSLQFTSLNTLTYADIPHDRMPRATALSSVVGQLSLSAGVAVAAFFLDLSRGLEGRSGLAAIDFSRALLAVGLISSLAVLWLWRLSADAGAAVSGHRVQPDDAQPTE